MLEDRAREDLIEAVVTTSRREIMPRFRRLEAADIATKTGPHDLVTEADLRTETALTEAFARILPGAAVVGEEAVSADAARLDAIADADLCIIVDPIDGTANFASGLAVFGVIVAVVARGETVFGLLFDPVMEDWVTARRGEGAWLESETRPATRLQCSTLDRLEGARGLVPLNGGNPGDRAPLMQRFSAAGQVQDLRCSCHDYRLVASGDADFMVSVLLNPWDHAAGQLVLAEAGGWSRVEGVGAYAPTLRHGRMVGAGTARLGEEVAERHLADG